MSRLASRVYRGYFVVVLAIAWVAQSAWAASGDSGFNIVEASIPEMRQAMESGQTTARELVEQHLIRIALYEEKVNGVMAVNPQALAEADRLDAERARGFIRGPLHGIPVALKDNIHTTDMPTTGGALAFRDFVPPYEATLAKNLRDAGAIIIAKTVMTELANFIGSGMPGNYSTVGGYGLNPYDPRRDPREGFNDGRPVMGVGGSSSGIGTAMSFWAANVGTETSGSILSPANANMLAAIKPTVGRISRWGIIPITADQDTAGPMARSVTDAAIMLGVLEGESADPNDSATSICRAPANNDYTPHLREDGLQGARIGIPRALYYEEVAVPGAEETRGLLNDQSRAVMAAVIEVLREQGAILVDPANIPSVIDPDPQQNLLAAPDSSVLSYGMKRDFNAWLATLGAAAPVSSLTALRQWNLNNQSRGALKYGQARLDGADELDLQASRDSYQQDRMRDIYLNATHGIDEVMSDLDLDALLFPASSGAGIAARPGYPTVIVPFAMVPAEYDPPLPSDFEPLPRPFGVSFTGMACSEARLIELAYDFEQATQSRVAPPAMP
ncbi:MAG: amidase family protein [Gammaproteobacteria bacterium]